MCQIFDQYGFHLCIRFYSKVDHEYSLDSVLPWFMDFFCIRKFFLVKYVMMLDLKMLFLWHLLRVRNIYITGILPEFLTKGFPALLNISKVSLFFIGNFIFPKYINTTEFLIISLQKVTKCLDFFLKKVDQNIFEHYVYEMIL